MKRFIALALLGLFLGGPLAVGLSASAEAANANGGRGGRGNT
jgi:hypothetical protein